MRYKRTMAMATALLALVLGGATIAVASAQNGSSGVENEEGLKDDDATEKPIADDPLGRASVLALEFTGGGSVTATEVEDEESYYEVEVTMDDGRQIDVQLDENFNVVGSEGEIGRDD